MGSVIISIDAELGWGFHDRPNPPMGRLNASREGWRHLLRLLERFEVPATWAVVGHLFLRSCDGVHEEHPAPEGWFRRERNEWSDRPDLRFGGTLVDELLDADVAHDIGCHTFSHVLFDDPRVTRDVVRAELQRAIELGAERGVDYDSFVFPRNAPGYRDVLTDYGFSAYRGGHSRSSGIRDYAGKIASVGDPTRVSLIRPSVDEYGMVNVPPSLFLFGIEGAVRTAFESVWVDPIVRQAISGIDRAAQEDGSFHMWLHPNNLTAERDVERIRTILEHLDRRRRDSALTVETMSDVAERVG